MDAAWPSAAELRRKTMLTERAVRSALAELVALGELLIEYNAGPGGVNRYCVITSGAESAPGNFCPPAESAPGQSSAGSASPQVNGKGPADSAPPASSAPGQDLQGGGADIAPGTRSEPEKNSSTKSSSHTEGATLFGEDSGATQLPRRRKTSRPVATRIPDDFAITLDMRAWAKEKIPHYDVDTETEEFIDYWRGRGDSKALKADWVATWRTWMRRNARISAAGTAASQTAHANGHSAARANAKQINYSDEEYTRGW